MSPKPEQLAAGPGFPEPHTAVLLRAWQHRAAAALLLLLPLFAMQVTDQVVWDVADFALFGAMLVGVGVSCELAARKTGNTAYRSAVSVALAAAFILVWVNGAVGVIGTERDDANLMYGGALAQALVAVIALIAGFGSTGPAWPLDILALTGFFAALWLVSAWLFRKAARSAWGETNVQLR